MQDKSPDPGTDYEWRPCSILFPRVGKLMNREGIHTRLILPGAYYVRRSRTLGERIYRIAR